jgi:hypothetical protein
MLPLAAPCNQGASLDFLHRVAGKGRAAWCGLAQPGRAGTELRVPVNPHTMIREDCTPQTVTRQETIGEKKVESKTPVTYTSVLKLTGERRTEYRGVGPEGMYLTPQ